MIKLFIPTSLSFASIKELIEKVETLDINVENTAIGNSFADFSTTLNNGDTVIVQSLDFFPSLVELLATLAKFDEQNITLRSIDEPWLNQPVENTADFLEKLRTLAVKMHAERTNQGLQKARTQGKTLGRRKGQCSTKKITPDKLAEIELLRREEHLTITQACQRIGCSSSTYHIAKREIAQQTKHKKRGHPTNG